MGRRADVELDQRILADARAGVSITELAARYGVTRQRIHQRLRRADPNWRSSARPSGTRIVDLTEQPAEARADEPSLVIDLRTESDRWVLTPREVAEAFGVDAKTITRWARSGRLPFVTTLGGHRRYPRAAVQKLLADRSTPVGD